MTKLLKNEHMTYGRVKARNISHKCEFVPLLLKAIIGTTLFTPFKILYLTGSILFIATAGWADVYTVEEVVDGNILILSNGEQVKMIGVDSSEFKQEANNFVEKLVKGKKS